MEQVKKICAHPIWKWHMEHLEEYESERIFCRHGIQHLLDVARIAYIENLENGYGFSKELIYSAALLHDIGRFLQYTQGIPHEKGGRDLAEEILKECAFEREEQEEILNAISRHRDRDTKEKEGLCGLLYRADKKSRNCGFCKASDQCNWSMDKKNLHISI